MAIRSLIELQDELDVDFAWRLREISAIAKAVSSATEPLKSSLLRAGITLLYAHWEGFTKHALRAYSYYVSSRQLRYRDLNVVLSGVVLRGMIRQYSSANSPSALSRAALEIDALQEEVATIRADRILDEIGNMNFDSFRGCLDLLGIDYRGIDTKRVLIDSSLLRSRHDVAHGKYVNIDDNLFKTLTHEVVSVLRGLKNNIENCASRSSYRRNIASAP